MLVATSAPAVGPQRSRRAFLIAALLAVACCLLYAAVAGFEIFSPRTRAVISDVMLIPAAGCLAVATGRRLREAGPNRRSWRWLCVAGVLWMVAETVWAIDTYVLNEEGSPNPSDVFYLAATVPAAVAMLALPMPSRVGAERLRLLIGGLIVALGVLFVARAVILPAIFAAAPSSTLARTIYLAYPSLDAVLFAIALINLVRAGSRARAPLGLFTLGVLSYTGSDAAYTYYAALDRYQAGSVLDVGWLAGYLLMALSALVPERDPSRPVDRAAVRRAEQRANVVGALVVYLPIAAAVTALAFRTDRMRDPLLVVLGAVLLVLLGIRQALMAVDNGRLTHHLQEQVVELRSRGVELHQLAEQNSRIVQAVAEGVFGVDHDGRVTFVNPATELMLGRAGVTLVGSREGQMIHPHEEFPSICPVQQALSDGIAIGTAHSVFRHADGTDFPVELAVGPLLTEDTVIGAVVVFRDISERRAVERMKDEFISVVSHELRTPLTAIRGSLGIVASGAAGQLSDRGTRLIDIAAQSTERLSRLINDMLDIERIESGAETMRFADWDAASLVNTAIDGLRFTAEERQVGLMADGVSGQVHADGDRVVQTLTNLIGNAIKFSEPGTAVVVSAEPRDGEVEFRVADQGRGIPPEKLAAIFERFEQVDSTDAREKGGTGLGLTISRSIVQRHGGRIWAESMPGCGATLLFTLPRGELAAQPLPR